MTIRVKVLVAAFGIAFAVGAAAQPNDEMVVPGALLDLEPIRAVASLGEDSLKTVEIANVTGTIDLAAAAPVLRLRQDFRNPGATRVSLPLRVMDADEKELQINPRETKTLRWEVPLKVREEGKRVRSVTVVPAVIAESAPSQKPTRSFSLDLVLPPGATKLVKSTQPIARVPGDRLAYRWSGQNVYLTSLKAWWTTSPVDLTMKKDAQPDWANKTVDVTIRVKNAGQAPARNVVLKDDFPAEVFEADPSSQGAFKVYKGDPNDQRLLWEYGLPDVPPGGEATIKYRLKLKIEVPIISLHETNAIEDGEPIAVTGKVRLAR